MPRWSANDDRGAPFSIDDSPREVDHAVANVHPPIQITEGGWGELSELTEIAGAFLRFVSCIAALHQSPVSQSALYHIRVLLVTYVSLCLNFGRLVAPTSALRPVKSLQQMHARKPVQTTSSVGEQVEAWLYGCSHAADFHDACNQSTFGLGFLVGITQ